MPYEKSSPASPEAQSGSPVQENLQALAALFPSVVRDGQVDIDALRQLCGEAVVKENELFGLNWRGKTEARRAALLPSLGTLRPCKEESKNWDTTQNLYIEGDNLEVLKLLRKSYGGKVKMIYIDPPYNTGKEFVYPDDYQNGIENYKKLTGQEGKYAANVESSGRYHTDWLNMMYPRLMISRELLREDGVIFISIDDNEAPNLLKICNEVFGESNQIGIISNTNNPKGRSDDKYLATAHEYIIVFAKCIQRLRWYGFEPTEEITKRYNKIDINGKKYREIDLRKTGENDLREDRPNLFYYFYYNESNGDFFPSNDDVELEGYIKIKPQREDLLEGNWRWGLDTSKSQISLLVPKFMPTRKVWGIMQKDYLEGRSLVKPTSSWLFKDVNSERGTEEFVNLGFDKRVFPKPKPIGTVLRCCKLSTEADDIIIDFFSGSSTTAHAVMKLNSEDGGKRKYIMVQLPEPCEAESVACKSGYKNICEIGKDRIRRAGEKVKEEAELAGQNLDIGFRVYKLDSSNVKAWNPQEEDLVEAMSKYAEHLVGGRTEDDFLTEIMLKSGIDLVEEVQEREIAGHRVQSLGYGQYYACMAADLADDEEDVALGIAAWHEEDCAFAGGEQQDTCTVFVSDRAFASNDAAKMNFVAILEQHGICNIKAL